MICYKDKTWCNAHKCTYYTVCKEALPYAKKIQQKQEGCQWLPYQSRRKTPVFRHGDIRRIRRKTDVPTVFA